MGKTLSISVSKDTVLKEVGKITGYTGKKAAADGSQYERIATFDENEELLSGLFVEACSSLCDAFKRHIRTAPTFSTTFSVSLTLPNNWETSLSNVVNESAKTYVISYICAKWMRIAGEDVENKYANDADAAMMEIRRLVSFAGVPNRSDYVN